MKNVAKAVVIALVLVPFLSGCAKRCGGEPVMKHRLEKCRAEYGGK